MQWYLDSVLGQLFCTWFLIPNSCVQIVLYDRYNNPKGPHGNVDLRFNVIVFDSLHHISPEGTTYLIPGQSLHQLAAALCKLKRQANCMVLRNASLQALEMGWHWGLAVITRCRPIGARTAVR